jgi:hypothetical protein
LINGADLARVGNKHPMAEIAQETAIPRSGMDRSECDVPRRGGCREAAAIKSTGSAFQPPSPSALRDVAC